MTSNQLTLIHQNSTGVALNKKLSASCDSSVIEEDVTEVSKTVPAQSVASEFEAYLSSFDENHAFSDADSAYCKLITS